MLRALLDLDESVAVDAARRWLSAVDLRDLDHGQSRLLPMLYWRLREAGAEDIPALLRGTYRRTWVHNQLRFREVGGVLDALQEEGIPTVVLKGASLVAAYGDWGIRSMTDVDVLVPAAATPAAVRVLTDLGWAPALGIAPEAVLTRMPARRHSWGFSLRDGVELDLHWHAFGNSLGSGADRPFFEAATPMELNGATIRRLDDGDLLLHIIEHAHRGGPDARLQWMVDAVTLVRSTDDVEACGTRLAAQARSFAMLEGCRAALDELAAVVDEPRLEAVRHATRTAAPLARERLRHRAPGWGRHGGGKTSLLQMTAGWARERLDLALVRRRWWWVVHVATGRRPALDSIAQRVAGPVTRTPLPTPRQPTDLDLAWGDGGVLDRYGGPGWSFPEDAGTWTDGTEARLVLPSPARPATLTLELDPFPAWAGGRRRIDVTVDGASAATVPVDETTPATVKLDVPITARRRRRGLVEVGLVVRRPAVPANLGISNDTRRLGLYLRSVRLR